MTSDRRGLIVVMQVLVFWTFFESLFFYPHHFRTTCEAAFTGETSRVRFFCFNGLGRRGKYIHEERILKETAPGRGGAVGEERGGSVVCTWGMMMLMTIMKGTPRSFFLAHEHGTGRAVTDVKEN